MKIDGKTKIFGCIAHPTAHVRAPSLFNPIFIEENQNSVMIPLDIHPDGLADAMRAIRNMPNFHGAAVTIPHKMTLASLCDELGAVAQITGAVNAVRFHEGRILGDNFDGAGFVAGLKGQNHDVTGKRILLIGAGGAARAIAYALCCEPIKALDCYNRTKDKASQLRDAVRAHVPDAPLGIADLGDLSGYDIIINATSLGLYDGDAMPCELVDVKKDALICDIIMTPQETAWLKEAASRGLNCHFGKHMLDYQLSFIGNFIGAFDTVG